MNPETAPPVLPVKVDLSAFGRGTVEVDGHDLTNKVTGLQLHSQVNEVPTLILFLAPTAGAEFDGFARVVVGEPPDPGPAAAAFLEAIDPKILEQAALNRPDLDNEPHGTTRAILRQLQEWANGWA